MELNSSFTNKKVESSLLNKLFPIPWELWPAEARLLFALIVCWSIAGLFILGSASWWVANREMGDGAYYLKRQIIWLIASWSLLWFTISRSIKKWLRISGVFVFFGFLMVGATLLVGSEVNGSSRWLIVGPIQIQPSELIKPFIILQASNIFAQWNRIKSDQKIFWISLFCCLLILILKQPNLSTAALTGILIWLMALASGMDISILFGTAFFGSALGIMSIMTNEYQKIRVMSFLNPWNDPQGSGYQLIQSLLAIGSGGWLGEGFGMSTQKLQYLPIQSTDFIYAVFAEEFGFIGTLTLFLFLLLIAFLGLRVSLRCKTNQSKLVSIGCSTLLVGQSLMNIAVASGAMPTTGLPLPMISYGGNSLIASFLISGLLIRCSIESNELLGNYNRPRK